MSKPGEHVSLTAHIVDSAGADTDPTTVKMFLREEVDGTELEWIYNAAPTEGTHYPTGMNAVVKDSTGDYSVLFVLRKPERHTVFWKVTNTALVTLTQNLSTVFVRHAGIDLVEP